MYVEERKSIYRKNPPHGRVPRRQATLSPMRLYAPWPVEEIRNKFVKLFFYLFLLS